MTNQELVTCAIEGIPIKVAVINNGNLGMVRQWQTLFYDGRYSNTDLQTQAHPRLRQARRRDGLRRPALREGRGRRRDDREGDGRGRRCRSSSTSSSAQDAMVWPMVPAGTSNDEILAARDTRPVWGEDDV